MFCSLLHCTSSLGVEASILSSQRLRLRSREILLSGLLDREPRSPPSHVCQTQMLALTWNGVFPGLYASTGSSELEHRSLLDTPSIHKCRDTARTCLPANLHPFPGILFKLHQPAAQLVRGACSGGADRQGSGSPAVHCFGHLRSHPAPGGHEGLQVHCSH